MSLINIIADWFKLKSLSDPVSIYFRSDRTLIVRYSHVAIININMLGDNDIRCNHMTVDNDVRTLKLIAGQPDLFAEFDRIYELGKNHVLLFNRKCQRDTD